MPRHRSLNVAQLRRLLAEMPDDAPVLVPEPDHSFRAASAGAQVVLSEAEYATWSECYGNEDAGAKTLALVIR